MAGAAGQWSHLIYLQVPLEQVFQAEYAFEIICSVFMWLSLVFLSSANTPLSDRTVDMYSKVG
jgi:hypothetical protein